MPGAGIDVRATSLASGPAVVHGPVIDSELAHGGRVDSDAWFALAPPKCGAGTDLGS